MTLGIRSKLLLVMTGILLVVLSVDLYLQMSLQRQAFDSELAQRTQLMQDNLQHRALAQAEILADLTEEYISAYNFFDLINTAKTAAAEAEELSAVVVYDKFNQVYVDTARPGYSGSYETPPFQKRQAIANSNLKLPELYEANLIDLEDDQGLEIVAPLMVGQEQWGNLKLIYSLASLKQQIAASQDEHLVEMNELKVKSLSISVALLIFSYFAILQISKRLIHPILELTHYTQQLAKGKFDNIAQLSPKTNLHTQQDEIGELTNNFISMANNLEQSHKELANYSQTLEQKVEQRTYALNLNNAALKQALSELEESQQQLIHSEKMAALGQLISGIAHEINTPLGAVQASADNNALTFRALQNSLSEHIRYLDSQGINILKIMLDMSLARIENGVILSTREERQLKKQINQFLQDKGLENSLELTNYLSDILLEKDLLSLTPYLGHPFFPELTKLAHSLSALERNNQTILSAVGKASKVVFSLKNFSHHDSSGNKISSNINYGIQTVLVLYQNFLKQGCTVIEEFGELPDIPCYPDELNQVWTNLIHNALYAMQNQGTLTIRTQANANQIIVEIQDSGCGIPEAIQNKVFQSFFTTKPAGEGSGLGLGICKRIIDKHQGTISFNSEPGKTIFQVRLPILKN